MGKDKYADACNALEERVNNAVVHAEDQGLTTTEVVAELRRIAGQLEDEQAEVMVDRHTGEKIRRD